MTLTKDFRFCVGLDISEDCDKFIKARKIIEQTSDLVDYYKINPAFYLGPNLQYLYLIAEFLHSQNIPWIYDGKLGDIGNTSERYAEYVYDYLKAGATTLTCRFIDTNITIMGLTTGYKVDIPVRYVKKQ